jgi:hypothetical protein
VLDGELDLRHLNSSSSPAGARKDIITRLFSANETPHLDTLHSIVRLFSLSFHFLQQSYRKVLGHSPTGLQALVA